MLHLIAGLLPAPAHRVGLRVAHAVRVRWWRVRKPEVAGCRVLAFDDSGSVLLIRHTYGSRRWMPPGGGLAAREDPVAGATRELREETGCHLERAVIVAVVEERLHGAANGLHIVAGRASGRLRIDRREIAEAGFFALDALPDDMPAQVRAGLPVWHDAWRG